MFQDSVQDSTHIQSSYPLGSCRQRQFLRLENVVLNASFSVLFSRTNIHVGTFVCKSRVARGQRWEEVIHSLPLPNQSDRLANTFTEKSFKHRKQL